MSEAMSLKARIRNLAKEKNIPAQVILQNFMFERLLVRLTARFETILTPLTIDVSTGDVITPHAERHRFTEIFDAEQTYELWAYNIETILAEKVETILRRGVFNTRPRDFYDVYILATTQGYDPALFRQALQETAAHRGTTEQISDVPAILQTLSESPELQDLWEKYRRQFPYAQGIEYVQIIITIGQMLQE